MKKLWALSLVFLTAPQTLPAAQSAMVLPELEKSAQSAALGDGASVLRGVNALGTNPAGLYTGRFEFMTQYQSLPLQTHFGSAGLALPLKKLGTAVGISYADLRSSPLERRNEFGESTGRFLYHDQMVGLHLSRLFSLGSQEALAGVSVKGISSRVDTYKGSSVAVDAGAQYAFKGLPLALGLTAMNMGKGPVLKSRESALPTSYGMSLGYGAGKPLVLVGSFTHYANEGRQTFSMGAQYELGKVVALRGRYALDMGAKTGETDLSGAAGGIGLNLGGQSLDYSFQPYDGALQEAGYEGAHKATLTFRY